MDTSCPFAINTPTASGVSAIRFSTNCVSLGIPMDKDSPLGLMSSFSSSVSYVKDDETNGLVVAMVLVSK
jgi:hypothetical protein